MWQYLGLHILKRVPYAYWIILRKGLPYKSIYVLKNDRREWTREGKKSKLGNQVIL